MDFLQLLAPHKHQEPVSDCAQPINDDQLFILFYLLNRKANYINYMHNARYIAEAILPFRADRVKEFPPLGPVVCCACYDVKPERVEGGKLLHGCSKCKKDDSVSYEVLVLCDIMMLNRAMVEYYMACAIELIITHRKDVVCLKW